MTMLAKAGEGLLLIVSLAIAVPAIVLFGQLMTAALVPPRPRNIRIGSPSGRVAVLMPAHDEAEGIAGSIRSVLAQIRPGDRLLVVADNCTDATAEIARASGAEVLERQDPERRGKGYALDHGVRGLEADPPSVVVVIDADCTLGPLALETLAHRCVESGRPCQALYLMHPPPGSGVGMRIAAFAWLVKNKLRPRGYATWRLPCLLMGTGMAFPWPVIRTAPLASGHLVEDMKLGLDLAASGVPPLFCEQAVVNSVFPSDTEAAKSQRTRWEHGHLSVIANVAPGLIGVAFRRFDFRLLAMALDLAVPPLASLALMLCVVLGLDVLAWIVGASSAPVFVAAVAWLLVLAGILAAWWCDGRQIVSFTDLLALPIYIFKKVPVYVRLFTKRQVEWVRTRRDDRKIP